MPLSAPVTQTVAGAACCSAGWSGLRSSMLSMLTLPQCSSMTAEQELKRAITISSGAGAAATEVVAPTTLQALGRQAKREFHLGELTRCVSTAKDGRRSVLWLNGSQVDLPVALLLRLALQNQ